MDNTSNKSDAQKKELDYFFLLLQNWKTIFLVSIVFSIIGFGIILLTPKEHTSKSTFLISLDKELNTPYGEYELITKNPLHYLSVINVNEFKSKVLSTFDSIDISKFKFKIDEEEPIILANSTQPIYPNKFDFLVSGEEKEKLDEINNRAIQVFLDETDMKLRQEMFDYFTSSLILAVEDIEFNIQMKRKLIEDLKDNLKLNTEEERNEINIGDIKDNRLLSVLDGSDKGVIISMLLNSGKGSEYYQNSILTVENIELIELENQLAQKKTLLSSLIDKEKSLPELFKKPFSKHYLSLTSPEAQSNDFILGFLKKTLAFFLFGFFVATTIILIRSYYHLKRDSA